MPSSNPDVIGYICDYIIRKQPKSVLDCGMGFGKYGMLAREYTDIWNGRIKKKDWKTVIDGVEVFKNYITHQRYIYTNVFEEGIYHYIERIKHKYDLILLVDVLEHFDKKAGEAVLKKIKEKGRNAIIVTPVEPSQQGDVNNNRFERHISKWSYEELAEYGTVITQYDRTFILLM